MNVPRARRVAVVGAGISGLVVAYRLANAGIDVILHEAGTRPGGKVSTSPLAGRLVDEGADAFLVREPALANLCRELGLDDQLVAPATGRAAILAPEGLRWLPGGHLLGVPFDLDALAASGLVSAEAVARAAADLTAPADSPDGDESVGALVRRRLGDEVFERMTDPLLSGINAGTADELSLQAGLPRLAEAARGNPSLMTAIRAHLAMHPPAPGEPVFLSPASGTGAIVDALMMRLAPAIRLASPVTTLAALDADTVVLATPAFVSAELLAATAPRAGALAATIPYASVTVVSAAFAPGAVAHFDGSGFLVPRSSGLLMTACSFASTKWAHLGADGTTIVRISAGRIDDDRPDHLDDDALAAALLSELDAVAPASAAPAEVRVTRWPRSLPQYRVGHGGLVNALTATLAEETAGSRPVHLVGAAYTGLGLPACVAAANRVAARLGAEWIGSA